MPFYDQSCQFFSNISKDNMISLKTSLLAYIYDLDNRSSVVSNSKFSDGQIQYKNENTFFNKHLLFDSISTYLKDIQFCIKQFIYSICYNKDQEINPDIFNFIIFLYYLEQFHFEDILGLLLISIFKPYIKMKDSHSQNLMQLEIKKVRSIIGLY